MPNGKRDGRPPKAKNVLGGTLQVCSNNPKTGFFRDGCCNTGPQDRGLHMTCAVMTDEFLAFSKAQGNDLSTPFPEYNFPGLKEGDRWCLCALRWVEAYQAGKAPKIILEATHEYMLRMVSLEILQAYQLPKENE